jgi:hypothetical protein
LTACRFEQATLRANEKVAGFTPPELVRLDAPLCALRRGRYAGIVLFHGDPGAILNACIRWSAMPGNSYAVIPPGKQILIKVSSD